MKCLKASPFSVHECNNLNNYINFQGVGEICTEFVLVCDPLN